MGTRLSKRGRIVLPRTSEFTTSFPTIPRKQNNGRRPGFHRNLSEQNCESLDALDTFRIIDGRVFQNENERYLVPSDELEYDRLEWQHDHFKKIWGTNFSAPVDDLLENRAFVLDIACGAPAVWICDMSKQFPNCSYVGIDMVPVFKNVDNSVFIKGNILYGLPFADDVFDFVYQRFLWAALSDTQWVHLIQEISRVTKPGRYIELMEFECDVTNPGPITKKFVQAMREHLTSRNINPMLCRKIPKMMASTNRFTDIRTLERTTPMGGWAKNELGLKQLQNFLSGLSTFKVAIKCSMCIGDDEYESLLEGVKKESLKYKMHIKTYRFYGKKIA